MKRGQASTEYLMVAAVALLVIVPMVYIIFSSAVEQGDKAMEAKLSQVGKSIMLNAKQIYYLPPPAKNTIVETIPDGVIGMQIVGQKELIFNLSRGGELVFSSDVPIDGDFNETTYSGGQKTIRFEKKATYVNITIT